MVFKMVDRIYHLAIFEVHHYFKTKLIMKHLFILILLFYFQISNSQTYDWVNLIGGDGFDFSNQVAIDDEGNVYNSGFYRDGNFMISDSILPFVDNMDSYFAKYSSSGDLLWVIPLYGLGKWDRTEAIQVDNNGDVYLLSTVENELSIGDQEDILIPEENIFDILLMKFTAQGELLWHKIFGGSGSNLGYNMLLNDQEIILVGHFLETLVMGDFELNADDQDMFITSLDLDGNVNWAQKYGGTGLDRLYSVAKHSNGDLAVCGYSRGGWQFGSTLLETVDDITHHSFIGRLDSEGNPIWAAQMLNEFRTQSQNITTDNNGNSYISYYDDGYDKFQIAKYDADGIAAWEYSSENSTDTLTALATEVIFMNGKLFVTGYLSKGNNLFGTVYNEIENTDYLLAIINPDGTLDTLLHDGGSGKIKSYGMYLNSTGAVALSILANGIVEINNTNLGMAIDDILVVKLNIDDMISSITEQKISNKEIVIYPNPSSGKLFFENKTQLVFDKIFIYSQLGKLVLTQEYSNKIDLGAMESGYYLVRLEGREKSITLKLIVEE